MDLNTKGFIKKKVSLVLKMIVLLACFIIYMFPFVMVVINSFKTKRDIIKEPLALIGTNGASVTNYLQAFTKMNFPRTFMHHGYQRSFDNHCFFHVRIHFRAY